MGGGISALFDAFCGKREAFSSFSVVGKGGRVHG
jgi:hypothetical protein